MHDRILRKLFLGFIQIHILHHASIEPIYGAFMIAELKRHGYDLSPGTLYPLLHSMADDGLLIQENQTVGGKIRKYYRISASGLQILDEARQKAKELFGEIKHQARGSAQHV